MSTADSKGISRRNFLAGAGVATATAAAGLYYLKTKSPQPGRHAGVALGSVAATAPRYDDFTDLWRQRWTWDRVAKGTHTRTNCISACSFDLFVRDGVVWREEQAAVYEAPRPGIPDANPRGCQKGACYSDLQAASSRVLHPLKRAGERGEGKWKRISWDQAFEEIAEHIVDAAVEGGTETIVHDHGTTNAGYGPETSAEIRFVEAVNATLLDSWSGVGDMPMGCVQTWGMYNCEGTADDWFRSDYIIVWIGNPAYTRIPDVHFMNEARYRGAKLVVIAPDYNATAMHADLWINPRPETDAALALAAAHVIVTENLYDVEYIREQTDLPILIRTDNGNFLRATDLGRRGGDDQFFFWDEAKGRLAPVPGCKGDGGRKLALGKLRPALEGRYTARLADGSEIEVRPVFEAMKENLARHSAEATAATTGVAASVVQRFAREMAAAPAAMIFASWGACKHFHSDLFQRSMILLMALTGNQGKPGAGMRVAAWWGLDGLDAMGAGIDLTASDMLRVIPKAIRGMTPADYEEFFIKYSEQRATAPLIPFLYVHGGYREMWSRPDLADPALPRELDSYVREAIDRGWTQIHPPEGRDPRVFIFTGCNPLRRWPAPQIAERELWPKLKCIVSVNFRMSTSGALADYVLPAAAYYEKYGIKYAQTYIPYVIVADKATEPLGEALSEWELFGRLTEAVANRAKDRGVSSVPGFFDKPFDLTKAYDSYTSNGRFDPYDPEDPVKLMQEVLGNSPSLGNIDAREALKIGAVRIVGPARPTPIYATSSDYDPNDTHWPHRWFLEDKIAWPTLTGRQQFYIDHPWYVEAGEALPVHKDPPSAGSRYPLRIAGGHTRWSVHAIWRDHELMLRLQRGEPVAIMNPVDTAARGLIDGDSVRVFNDTGSFECALKTAPATQPGEVIVYHAWEPYQFKKWKGQDEPVESPWKAIHLAGDYGHIHYRMFYSSPSHVPRGAPCQVERA